MRSSVNSGNRRLLHGPGGRRCGHCRYQSVLVVIEIEHIALCLLHPPDGVVTLFVTICISVPGMRLLCAGARRKRAAEATAEGGPKRQRTVPDEAASRDGEDVASSPGTVACQV